MADNILRDPENPRYHSFKHENDTIKRRLIQPKGALEYALEVSPLLPPSRSTIVRLYHPSFPARIPSQSELASYA